MAPFSTHTEKQKSKYKNAANRVGGWPDFNASRSPTMKSALFNELHQGWETSQRLSSIQQSARSMPLRGQPCATVAKTFYPAALARALAPQQIEVPADHQVQSPHAQPGDDALPIWHNHSGFGYVGPDDVEALEQAGELAFVQPKPPAGERTSGIQIWIGRNPCSRGLGS
jgi:hypothetical protein